MIVRSSMKLVVGLGNPGDFYEGNRHNAGVMALKAFGEEKNLVFEKKVRLKAAVAVFMLESEKSLLALPLTFMNLSGTCVRRLLDYYKIVPRDMLVVYDDFHLPLGSLRIRERGSSGGHNGMESVIREAGTDEFYRLRIGIGTEHFAKVKSLGDDAVSKFVLSNFSRAEKKVLKDVLSKAVHAIELFLGNRLNQAMNIYNTKVKSLADLEQNS